MDLRLNENKIRSVHYSSLSRFGNLTYLNLTKNDISYVEDGAFSAQFNLQVSSDGEDASVFWKANATSRCSAVGDAARKVPQMVMIPANGTQSWVVYPAFAKVKEAKSSSSTGTAAPACYGS